MYSMQCATWYEGTAQLLSLTEFKSHLLLLLLFLLLFFVWLLYWLKQLTDGEGRKPEYPEKTLDDELQKMPHTKAAKFKPQARLKPAL